MPQRDRPASTPPAGTFAEAVVDGVPNCRDGRRTRRPDVGIGTAAGGGFLALEAAKCEKRCPDGAVGDVAVVDRATAGEAGDWLTPLGN